jgi:hypothetical protein
MPYPQFDRAKLRVRPLGERRNKVVIKRDHVRLDAVPSALPAASQRVLDEAVERIRAARTAKRPVMLAFGAHSIKNGLGLVLIRLIETGWVTHLATNGAGIIHDWEFGYQGQSSEDVRENVAQGQFGIWEDTGFNINLALRVGAHAGQGYGESVGALIQNEGLNIPDTQEFQQMGIPAGFRAVPHPFKQFSVQAAAYRLGVPFTGHPMFGHDIIYTHPLCNGPAIGQTAERDFLAFAHNVSQLEGGVYLSVGSAVMSPMIFEKALSMSNNVAIQQTGRPIRNHFIAVVDLAEAPWDWQKDGEPPADNPAYYLRYCKTFARMGGTMRYATADNRDFLLALCQRLTARPS